MYLGPTEQGVIAWLLGILTSRAILTACMFPEHRKILEQFFYELPFELVYTPKDLNLEDFPAVRDSKDTPILATAILENIDILVTGDKDLRVVETEYPEIMTMSEFIEKY